jgi:hypothetical protein
LISLKEISSADRERSFITSLKFFGKKGFYAFPHESRRLLLVVSLILLAGCLSREQQPSTIASVTSSPTSPLPPGTTPIGRVLLEGNKTIGRDNQGNWEISLQAGQRVAIDVITDGAMIDLVILDQPNYNIFKVAFSSRSGSLWESYVVLRTGITKEHIEFKAPLTSKYRIVIENADVIPNGAVTSRAVNVVVRAISLD